MLDLRFSLQCLFHPKDGGSMFHQNLGERLLEYMVLHPRRQLSPQIIFMIYLSEVEYIRNAMCAPSSGGKFLRTELMTHNATADKFSSQAFCRTFLETIIMTRCFSMWWMETTYSLVIMFCLWNKLHFRFLQYRNTTDFEIKGSVKPIPCCW
jgi:hypothetical protein